MSAAEELDPKPGMLVLDLCAAPGGKSGAVAARMKGRGILVSNETVPQRALTLSRTIERLGAVNTLVTNAHPELIAEEFSGLFDAVLVDAPCSGEGMFRKDETALKEWSAAHVKACSARQALILESASLSLKPGGVMVYSTCTFSYEENEGTVETFLKSHPEFELVRTQRLYPHIIRGEGHFTAKLIKKDGSGVSAGKTRPYRARPCKEESYHSFIKEVFEGEPSGEPVLLEDGRVIIVPGGMPETNRIRTVSLGVEAGRVIKGRFEPSHTLALSSGNQKFRKFIELSGNETELSKYLRGETLDAPSGASGYYPVTYCGYALGWGKCAEGVLKNHLPKGLRLNR
jgi:NOL1/NOP2/fmu family ribosome biogenesis protein/23S rRNA U2552 (ribose-2'-O)-methylase RlmE/FtsJ